MPDYLAQLLVKMLITIVFGVILYHFWRADLDIRALREIPRQKVEKWFVRNVPKIPTREERTLYQDGNLVGRTVAQPTVDARAKTASFDELFQTDALDLSRDFEYGKLRLKFVSADMMANTGFPNPERGRVIRGIKCDVIGGR